jgi:prepilin peptidase CpaA
MTGTVAMVLSLYFLVTQRAELTIAVASIYFSLVCATDTLYARIPNLLNAGLALFAVVYHSSISGWDGTLFSLSGLALGLGLLLLPYLMGGFGAGDVKALAALGALLGPQAILHVFVYMAFFGGGIALLHYVFHYNLKQKIREGWESVLASALSRDMGNLKSSQKESLRFPYAAAIAFGYYSYITWGGIL